EQIDGLTHYVLRLSGQDADTALADGVADLYQQQCATCHGANGEGDRQQGAPNLTDREWLYGSNEAGIYNTIYNARNSHMPAWQDRLDDASIKALAVYVHTLGGGE
ncbi:MAG: c-type cytochrome, partial [Pseudomonadota bacterium]